jgi:DNA-binding CsgD family transcriptional regulator/tetratricopeptide (TPR) repeat protein
MRALYRSGRLDEALRAFDAAAHSIALAGGEPSTSLLTLRSRILEDDPLLRVIEPSPGRSVPAQIPDTTSRTEPGTLHLGLPLGIARESGEPLIGRDAESRRLLDAAQLSTGGQSRALLLFGDAGIGKTRLVAEVATRLHHEGWLVLHGRCDDESVLRYQPISQALGSLIDAIGQSGLDRRVGEIDLTRLGPRFRRTSEPSGSADPTLEREELFEKVADLFDALAAHQPVLLIVDDLHWADAATVGLLRHLLRRPWRAPVLLMGTSRPEASDGASPLKDLVADLRRDHAAETLTLDGLPVEAVRDLAELACGYRPDETACRLIAEQTGGNAFLVRELVAHLDRLGALRPTSPGQAAIVLAREDLPEGVRDLLDHMLRALTPHTRKVLAVAAVEGPEFGAELVAQVSGVPVDDVVDLLASAESARLVSEALGAPGRYEFGHALIREHLLRSLPSLRRARIHRAMADALAARGATPAVIARHHVEAGPAADPEQGLLANEEAAEEASAALAFEAAAHHLESALAFASRLPAGKDAATSGQLLARLGHAWWQAGDMARADERFAEAIALARRTGDGALLAKGVLGHCRTSPTASEGYAPQADPELIALTEEALATLDGEPALRAQLLCRLAVESYWTTTLEERDQLVIEAVALAREAGDDLVLLDVLARRQLATWTTGDAAPRLARSQEILPLAVRLQSPYHEAETRLVRVLDLLELGDIATADREIARYVARAEELRQPYFGWHTDFLAALRALMDGRFADAEQLSQRALDLAERTGSAGPIALWGLQMLWSWREQGQTELLALALDGIDSVSGDLPAVDAARAWVAAELGDLHTSRDHFARMRKVGWANMPRDHTWLGGLALSTDTAVALGDRDAAAELEALLAPHRGRNILIWAAFNCGPAEYYLGRLALLRGDPTSAVEYLEDAERLTRTAGARPLLARARVELARALLAQGGADAHVRAGRLIDAGEKAAIELGMAPLARSAADLHSRVPRVPEQRTWDSLTPAQLRVARLAATGASNPEIAAQLHLSRHTVEAHMAAVLRTLDLRSRRELIARHGVAYDPTLGA